MPSRRKGNQASVSDSKVDLAAGYSRSEKTSERLAALGLVADAPLGPKAEAVVLRLVGDGDARVASRARELASRLNISNGILTQGTQPAATDVDVGGALVSPYRIMLSILAQEGQPHCAASPPQADSVRRLIAVSAATLGGDVSKSTLAGEMAISERQVDYYLDAARYTGVAELLRFLSAKGREFDFPISPDSFLAVSSQICSAHPVVARLVKQKLFGTFVEQMDSVQLVRNLSESTGGSVLSDVTALRRYGTAKSWSDWIFDGIQQISTEWNRRLPQGLPTVGLTGAELSRFGNPLGQFKLRAFNSGAPLYSDVLEDRVLSPKIAFSALDRWDSGEDLASEIDLDGFQQKKLTLEQVGEKSGLTRERARQIEVEILKDLDSVLRIETLPEELGFPRLQGSAGQPLMDISQLVLGSLVETLSLGPMSGHFPAMAGQSYSLGLDPFEVIRARFGSGLLSPVEVVGAIFSRVLSERGCKLLSSELGLWGEKSTAHQSQVRDLLATGAYGRNTRRNARIGKLQLIFQEEGPLKIERAARLSGESSPKALAAFMGNRSEFELDAPSSTWFLAGGREITEFTSVFEAMFFIVDQHGPNTGAVLIREAKKVYPVSEARLYQALDDLRVGRLANGEWDLVSRGGIRAVGEEPRLAEGLQVRDQEATYFMTADRNHLRGSGWVFPRWVGWKVGLVGTPQTAVFSSRWPSDGALTLTRRAQQVRASSILEPLRERGCKVGCVLKWDLFFEDMSYSLTHDCALGRHGGLSQ